MSRSIVAVIGRGHSGTRAAARLVQAAGFRLPVKNGSEDYVSQDGYKAARIAGACVMPDGAGWDIERLLSGPIDPAWRVAMESYLHEVWRQPGELVGWKLPEMVFCYPWLVRAYPEVRIVEIFRDPRDTVIRPHGTDDVSAWCRNIVSPGDQWGMKGQSWALQADIQLATAKRLPAWRWCRFRLRDMVHHPQAVQEALAGALGRPAPAVDGRRRPIGRFERELRGAGAMSPWIRRHLDRFFDDAGPYAPAVRDEHGFRLLIPPQ